MKTSSIPIKFLILWRVVVELLTTGFVGPSQPTYFNSGKFGFYLKAVDGITSWNLFWGRSDGTINLTAIH